MPESATTTTHRTRALAAAVESVLNGLSAVTECCAVVTDHRAQHPDITALVVPSDAHHPPAVDSLETLCRNALPSDIDHVAIRLVPALPRASDGGLLRPLIHLGGDIHPRQDNGTDPYALLGTGYSDYRKPDPRIAQMIETAFGSARTVLNIGAGTGSYEPTTRLTLAVEPSTVMIEQRHRESWPAVQAFAELLPFDTKTFDAALATMTVHLWSDAHQGLAEMRRVSSRQVIVTWDQAQMSRFWLVAEYLPDIARHEADLAGAQRISDLLSDLGASVSSMPIPVPTDCADGFLGAYWNRPEAYLDPGVRHSISILSKINPRELDHAMARLESDLASGAWHRRHQDLLGRDTLDLGYRLICAQ